MDVDSIIIRRSPVPAVIRMVAITVLSMLCYAVFTFAFDDYLEAFRHTEIVPFVEIEFAVFIFLVVFIITSTSILILRWSVDLYELREGEIVHRYGILHSREVRYALEHMETLTFRQSFVGRIFRYGTIEIARPRLKDIFLLRGILDPARQLPLIQRAKR